MSVDPPGCTDIDDALHCEEVEQGVYEVRRPDATRYFSATKSRTTTIREEKLCIWN